jgi:hypothetical protein
MGLFSTPKPSEFKIEKWVYSWEEYMKRTITFFILAALFVTSGYSVSAAEVAKQETVVTVTPRVWFAFADMVDEAWSYSDSLFMPMYGLTASVAPRFVPNWAFLATALYGTSDGDLVTSDSNHYDGSANYDRLDIELLARYTLPGTGLSLFFGPRYVNWQREQNVPAWKYHTNLETNLLVGEVGAGNVSAIGESGKHRFFSNIMLGLAFSDFEWRSNDPAEKAESGSDVQPLIDANIGYEYLFTSSSSISFRYRMFSLREENDLGMTRWSSFQGPEIGLSYRF